MVSDVTHLEAHITSGCMAMREANELVPARVLAQRNEMKFPNESKEYRSARNVLLAEEIELRRHIERVAQMRRDLPAGGRVAKNYEFTGETGQTCSQTSSMAKKR
jgi:hypothetical protein